MRARPPIRRATPDDDRHVATTLARSFSDDPLMMWLIPDDASRHRRQERFFHVELSHAHANGVVLTTDDHAGGALWLAPRRWKVDTWSMVREAPALLRSFGRRIPAALRLQEQMDAAHPREEHWYLSVLGTDPARQGTGVGGALITGVTDRCDATGIGAYLESSKEANIAYYERFGFVVTGEIQAGDSPVLHAMWRDPR